MVTHGSMTHSSFDVMYIILQLQCINIPNGYHGSRCRDHLIHESTNSPLLCIITYRPPGSVLVSGLSTGMMEGLSFVLRCGRVC